MKTAVAPLLLAFAMPVALVPCAPARAQAVKPLSPVEKIRKAAISAGNFGEWDKAVALLEAAIKKPPPGATTADRRAFAMLLADVHTVAGDDCLEAKEYTNAMRHYTAAYALDSVYRPARADADLQRIEKTCNQAGQNAAIALYDAALIAVRAVHDGRREASLLSNQGLCYHAVKQYDAATLLARDTGDTELSGTILNNAGNTYAELYDGEKSLDCYERSLVFRRTANDRKGEGMTLHNLGITLNELSRNEEATPLLEQSLAIWRELGNRAAEGETLNTLGNVYGALNRYPEALTQYAASLGIARALGNTGNEALELANIGTVYDALCQYETALAYTEQSLVLRRTINDAQGEASSLTNLGLIYTNLSRHEKAIGYHEAALTLVRAAKNRRVEGAILNNLGLAYSGRTWYGEAIVPFIESYFAAKEVGDRRGQGKSLDNLACAYFRLADYDHATLYAEQALSFARELQDRAGVAKAVGNLGLIYRAAKQDDRAMDCYREALRLAREVSDGQTEANTLTNLLATYSRKDTPRYNPSVAIFWGKQAVATLRELRGTIGGLDRQTQKMYFATGTATYRRLAGVLIAQNRLSEAQAVLDQLKSEERLDFVGRGVAASREKQSDILARTPLEMQLQAEYQTLCASCAEKAQTVWVLQTKRKRSPEGFAATDAAQLTQAEARLTEAQTAFDAFFAGLPRRFSGDEAGAAEADAQVTRRKASLRDLSGATRSRTVMLHFLAGVNGLEVLCTTPDRQTAYSTPVSAAQLVALVARFRAVLTNPSADPRPLGKKLYDVLLKPLEADLHTAKAQTLLVSLDGATRYVPLGALSPDGKTYLVERYKIAVQTGDTPATLATTGTRNGAVLALGTTEAHTVNLPTGESLAFGALPGVADEMRAVPGAKPLLDTAFTKSVFLGTGGKYDVLHVASHFHVGVDDRRSFLLLGDGAPLTLHEVLQEPIPPFVGVSLLLLSACDTATVGSLSPDDKEPGGEVDSFAAVAQAMGARSVMASLWQVSDASTARLLTAFYKERGKNRNATKAELLRRAQLSLATGRGVAGKATRATAAALPDATPDPDAPPFAFDPQKPYAHPYYWAPFVLIGDVR